MNCENELPIDLKMAAAPFPKNFRQFFYAI